MKKAFVSPELIVIRIGKNDIICNSQPIGSEFNDENNFGVDIYWNEGE